MAVLQKTVPDWTVASETRKVSLAISEKVNGNGSSMMARKEIEEKLMKAQHFLQVSSGIIGKHRYRSDLTLSASAAGEILRADKQHPHQLEQTARRQKKEVDCNEDTKYRSR